MKKERKPYRPRGIDRALFAILAVLQLANGLYLVGPWYLDADSGGTAPVMNLFNSPTAVIIFGGFIVLNGIALLYASAGRGVHYTRIVSAALLSGFLLRLYSLIGVFLVLESWRPPAYLSHAATVAALASYWVWVKVSVRPTE